MDGEEKNAQNNAIKKSTEITENKAYTTGQAVHVFSEFANTKTSENEKLIFTSIFDHAADSFTFKLQNKIQFDIFNELKQEFLDYIRKKLHNNLIQIDAIITTAETVMKPRTEQEKFEAMVTKNPSLQKLKESLNLDLLF